MKKHNPMVDREDLISAMREAAQKTEEYLSRAVENEEEALALLFSSMRYSLLSGGKRIRPFLTLSFCRLFGGKEEACLPFAAAVEMVHTYSLIHDDLPCMDDDEYRRGRLTNHKVYGEATAVLAGDALLTFAFETLTHAPVPDADIVRAVGCLSAAAGCRGMVGGQIMDMAAENHPDIPLDTLRLLQARKTGALIRAAAALGCIAAGVRDAERLDAADAYAEALGSAFQITDDILDAYGNAELLGKAVGRDLKENKTTFLSFMSREEACAVAASLTEKAKAAIAAYPGAESLMALADGLLTREK